MIRELGHGMSIAEDTDGKPFAVVCIDAASFLRDGAELLRGSPVQALDLGKSGAHMAELAAMPVFQQMKRLVLHDLDDAGATALGAARGLAVRELVAIECGLTGTGARALLHLAPQLEVLDLSKNAIGGDGAAALHDARLDHLTSLVLFGCGLDDTGVTAIAGSKHLHVSTLELGGDHTPRTRWRNRITTSGATALARAGWIAKLERLVLAGTLLGDEGAKALAAIGAPGPIDLDLRHDVLEVDAVKALAGAAWSRLVRLGLTGNLIHGDAMQDSYDYDGSVVARVPIALSVAEIGARYGFTARGVTIY